jgi:hypothetical protein
MLERLLGGVLAVVTMFILFFRGIFAFGEFRRYRRLKNM